MVMMGLERGVWFYFFVSPGVWFLVASAIVTRIKQFISELWNVIHTFVSVEQNGNCSSKHYDS
jgi:hypothetical protein